MSVIHESTELAAFHQFVGQRLRDSGPIPTPAEVLSEWELKNRDARRMSTIQLIQEALDELDAGDVGQDANEHLRETRQLLERLNEQ